MFRSLICRKNSLLITMQNLVTTLLLLHLIAAAIAVVVVVAGVLVDFWGFQGVELAGNKFFNCWFFLLQLLQSYFLIVKSEYSKGFQAVTSCKNGGHFVTSCYTFVTSCYKVCYTIVTTLKK